MPEKVWKHEKACARSEALIEDTVQKSEKPGWGTCATLVITALRKKKSKDAPLALHFIAVSATEMLSERHDNARLCLGAAMAVADPRMMMLQQRLFQATFSRDAQGQAPDPELAAAMAPPPEVIGLMQHLMAQLAQGKVPEGMKAVKLPNGQPALLGSMKLPIGTFPQGGDPKGN